jgi:DeoR family fructose operon transcriptional repressor
MTDMNNPDAESRRSAMVEALRAGHQRVDELAEHSGVSAMTVRRDLQVLEERGEVQRVRGGAVLGGARTFQLRMERAGRAKATIAEKLLPMVPETGAIGLDASSTIHHLGVALAASRPSDLMVVTAGLETFHLLSNVTHAQTYLTGGTRDPRTGSMVGPLACASLEQFTLTRSFLSAALLDAEVGSSEATPEEAQVKRVMAQNSGETVLAVDSRKLGGRAIARCLTLDLVDVLVTELAPNDAELAPYRDQVEVR